MLVLKRLNITTEKRLGLTLLSVLTASVSFKVKTRYVQKHHVLKRREKTTGNPIFSTLFS